MLKKSSPLKQLGQMEPNLAGSIYVRSKTGIDGPWLCPFRNCVRQPHPSFKDGCCFFNVMIISLWNLLQYHSIVRWAIQAQWVEPLVLVARVGGFHFVQVVFSFSVLCCYIHCDFHEIKGVQFVFSSICLCWIFFFLTFWYLYHFTNRGMFSSIKPASFY